eukprot:gene41201-50277_t
MEQREDVVFMDYIIEEVEGEGVEVELLEEREEVEDFHLDHFSTAKSAVTGYARDNNPPNRPSSGLHITHYTVEDAHTPFVPLPPEQPATAGSSSLYDLLSQNPGSSVFVATALVVVLGLAVFARRPDRGRAQARRSSRGGVPDGELRSLREVEDRLRKVLLTEHDSRLALLNASEALLQRYAALLLDCPEQLEGEASRCSAGASASASASARASALGLELQCVEEEDEDLLQCVEQALYSLPAAATEARAEAHWLLPSHALCPHLSPVGFFDREDPADDEDELEGPGGAAGALLLRELLAL